MARAHTFQKAEAPISLQDPFAKGGVRQQRRDRAGAAAAVAEVLELHVAVVDACEERQRFGVARHSGVGIRGEGAKLANFANFRRARSRLYQNEILQENMR